MAKVRATVNVDLMARMEAALERELNPVLDEGIAIREEFVKDWSDYNKPKFKKRIIFKNGKMDAQIYFEANPAAGSTEGISAFEFVRDGTSVRRVNLSGDWESKTKANSLETKPGRGQVIDVNKEYEFPGIDPRNTDKLANAKIDKKLKDAIRRALISAQNN